MGGGGRAVEANGDTEERVEAIQRLGFRGCSIAIERVSHRYNTHTVSETYPYCKFFSKMISTVGPTTEIIKEKF